eukprot:c24435_g1_i1 orf=440-2686(+)
MEDLIQLAETMQQAASILSDEDTEDAQRQAASFLSLVALGNIGAGKSAALNSILGYPVLPTGENGATRAPIIIDMQRDESISNRGLVVQVENKTQQVSASAIRRSLQDRLSKGIGMSNSIPARPDEIYLKLRSSTAPSLRLIDLPGLDQRASDNSIVNGYAEDSDAIVLVVVPAAQAPEISSSRALKMAHDFDPDCTRTVGIVSKVDQAASDQRSLAAIKALLLGQGPPTVLGIQWVALIGQSVSIAAAHAGSVGVESSLETAWMAELESLKSILTGIPQSKLGRNALVDEIARQIRKRLKMRLPSILSGLEGKSQVVEEELLRLGEQMIQTSEGTRAIGLELCREFEDKFLDHINTGQGGGWKVVASFEGSFPKRMKELPLNDLFDINNVKRVVLEADGYQPYLLSPEKGLRSLIRKVLELAKDPAQLCVDEVHRVLTDIVSSAASSTASLGRFPPFRREIIAIASAALDEYRAESKKMVAALVDMECAFIPPQHFIRLVQRRLDRQRREDEQKQRMTRKFQDAEQSVMNRSTTPPQTGGQAGGSLKSLKDDSKESSLKISGSDGELTAGYLLKKSAKTNGWSKRWFVLNEKTFRLVYFKKPDEKVFRGIINLEECSVEEVLGKDDATEDATPVKTKNSKHANGPDTAKMKQSLAFKITNNVSYKTVVKAHHSIVLKAENMAEKTEWMNKLRSATQGSLKVSISSKVSASNESGSTVRVNLSDASLDTIVRRPVDPEEDLKMMAQEV